MKQGQNIRACDGALRIQYDPKWSRTRPFAVFVGGAAMIRTVTLGAATEWLSRKVKEWGWQKTTRITWSDWS